ncbi:hypothetical protein ACNSZH_16185 [Burkholderia gladioli]|uniref:hypothetical protein n=1 Tax=Burkholderia gladioli TaxID=28095 RepID=UPI003B987655
MAGASSEVSRSTVIIMLLASPRASWRTRSTMRPAAAMLSAVEREARAAAISSVLAPSVASIELNAFGERHRLVAQRAPDAPDEAFAPVQLRPAPGDLARGRLALARQQCRGAGQPRGQREARAVVVDGVGQRAGGVRGEARMLRGLAEAQASGQQVDPAGQFVVRQGLLAGCGRQYQHVGHGAAVAFDPFDARPVARDPHLQRRLVRQRARQLAEPLAGIVPGARLRGARARVRLAHDASRSM